MSQKHDPQPKSLSRPLRTAANAVGFGKAYNFVFWVIFTGALLGFTLARLPYLDFDGILCSKKLAANSSAAPGECFYLYQGRYRVGMVVHLAGILPAALLACFQFVPVVRRKALLFHRINGYVVLLLSLVGTIGAFMIARHAFGGGLDVQSGVGTISIMFLASLVMAYISIKRHRIEQHRAWMLRAWFYLGCIVTVRLIVFASAAIISDRDFYAAQPCDKIFGTVKSQAAALHLYPDCAPFFEGETTRNVAVLADVNGNPIEIATALGMAFGMSMWVALAIHAVGIEVYLHLTPVHRERLGQTSYQRQLEAGIKDPGSAGLTADRVGDAEKRRPAEG